MYWRRNPPAAAPLAPLRADAATTEFRKFNPLLRKPRRYEARVQYPIHQDYEWGDYKEGHFVATRDAGNNEVLIYQIMMLGEQLRNRLPFIERLTGAFCGALLYAPKEKRDGIASKMEPTKIIRYLQKTDIIGGGSFEMKARRVPKKVQNEYLALTGARRDSTYRFNNQPEVDFTDSDAELEV